VVLNTASGTRRPPSCVSATKDSSGRIARCVSSVQPDPMDQTFAKCVCVYVLVIL